MQKRFISALKTHQARYEITQVIRHEPKIEQCQQNYGWRVYVWLSQNCRGTLHIWCNDGGRCSGCLPMDNNIHIPLDLPDVRIVEITRTETEAWLIRVESTLNHTQCRKCGQSTSEFHGLDEPLRLRHLPLFKREADDDSKFLQNAFDKYTKKLDFEHLELEFERTEKFGTERESLQKAYQELESDQKAAAQAIKNCCNIVISGFFRGGAKK